MAICQACGRSNADDAKFCYSCGSPITVTPPVKVEIKSPIAGPPGTPASAPPPYSPRHVIRPGTCYYHPDLPSSFVCSRCGRSICSGCNKQYGVLNFCPECYWGLAPKIGYGGYPSGYGGYPNYSGYQMAPLPEEQRRSPFSFF